MLEVGHPPRAQGPDLQDLQARLSLLVGPGLGLVCRDIDGDPQELFPIEARAIAKAIPRRQREFAAGRSAARDAMRQIGWTPQAIACASDRSPVWPQGLTGSIAHCRSACLAIVAPLRRTHLVGVDIEEDHPLDLALLPSICTPEELDFLSSWPASERGRWGLRVFCAKEAYYKWQFPLTRRLLAFQDVQIAFDTDHSRFSVHASGSAEVPVITCASPGHWLSYQGILTAWLVGEPATETLDGADPLLADTSEEVT